jgi:hypothetical protein
MFRRLLLVSLLAAALWVEGADRRSSEKRATGVWSDACPCAIPCSCWRHGKANVPKCVNVQVYAPKSSGRSRANDPVFVLVGLPVKPYGSPSAYSLFIDKRMSRPVVDAMRDFFEDNYWIQPGTEQIVHVNARLRPDSQVVEIPGVLSYKAHLLSNDVDQDVGRYLYPWLDTPKQWTTQIVRYKQREDGFVEYSGTNSLFATFNLGEPELPARSAPAGSACVH